MVCLIKHDTAAQDISHKTFESRDRSSSRYLKSFCISVLLRIITEVKRRGDKAVIKLTECASLTSELRLYTRFDA